VTVLAHLVVAFVIATGVTAQVETPLRTPVERHRAAKEHERRGEFAEALADYLWCWDEGARISPGFVGVRHSFLPMDIARLGKDYPPALEAMRSRRNDAESRLRAGSCSSDDLADACTLNKKLEQATRNLVLFDEIRTNDAVPEWSREVFARNLLEPLTDARRYRDVMATVDDPVRYVVNQIDRARQIVAHLEQGEERYMRSSVDSHKAYRVRALARVFEASVGVGRSSDAEKVAQMLIEFSSIQDTYAELVDLAARAGDVELARSIAERGFAALPEASRGRLRTAFDKLPEKK
jgi:hypothetical protein